MKAAIIHTLGETPRYSDFPDPVPQDGQLLVRMEAASVKNLDKMRASGKHYASHTNLPAVVGIDGVGRLADGTRIYASGVSGMIAEQALVSASNYVVVPEGLDPVAAAALPNALIGSAMAIRYRANMQPGDTVLINGATGVTGKLAVQIAKHFGAGKIIVTGRNAASLEQLRALGADAIISLKQNDETIIAQLKALHAETPIHHVIDYLWGHPMELIIRSLGSSGLHTFTPVVRIVTVGEMAGPTINLPSSILRSSAIELMGSGIGSLSQAAMREYTTVLLPELFQLAAEGKLILETETASLKDTEAVWNRETAPGARLVITMD